MYKVTLDGTFTLLHTFGLPYAGLTLGPNGLFYGTNQGGDVFTISPEGTFAIIASSSMVANSQAALTMASDGYFYGTRYISQSGTTPSVGTVFKVSLTGDLTRVYELPFVPNSNPPICPEGFGLISELVDGPDHHFTGTSTSCGPNPGDRGTIFRLSPDGTLTTLHAFSGDAEASQYPGGSDPWAGVMLGSDGYLYGITFAGGIFNQGVLYRMSLAGAYTVLRSFESIDGGGTSETRLLEVSPGIFYGTTAGGMVFRYVSDSVGDIKAPVFSIPGDIAVNGISPAGATVTFSVSVTDDVDPNPIVTCDWSSGVTFPLGTTIVHCSAQDASGNVEVATFKVFVADAVAQTSAMTALVSSWADLKKPDRNNLLSQISFFLQGLRLFLRLRYSHVISRRRK